MRAVGSSGDRGRYAFTDMHEGNLSPDVGDDPAAVAANRSALAEHLGLSRIAWVRAQHGADVVIVDDVACGGGPFLVDGIVTATPGLGVAVLAADCATIVLSGQRPAGPVVGAAHCGRPGLVAGIVPAVVSAMRGLGAGRLSAIVGPSICGGCYEVPADMRDAVAAAVPAARATTRHGTPAVDVGGGVRAQLADAGVDDVVILAGCTCEDPALFSYRRDRVTGRHAGVGWIQP